MSYLTTMMLTALSGLARRVASLRRCSWVWITGLLMLLAAAGLYRERPKLTPLLTSFIFGVFFDVWGIIFAALLPELGLGLRIGLYTAGILLAPLGTAVYFQRGFAKTAFDILWQRLQSTGR